MPYVRPGTYSQFVQSAGTVILGAGARVLAIIGPSYNYKIAEEAITRGGAYPYQANSADSLSNSDVTEILSVGDIAYSSDYTENLDYVLTGDTVDWSLGGSEPSVGDVYYVRYKYSKASTDYNAQVFYSHNEAITAYSRPVSDNNLAIAMSIYFENGPAPVIGVQVLTNNVQGYKDAIDKLKYTVEGIDPSHIICLSTDAEVRSYLISHVNTMSSQFERKERRCLVSTAINTAEASMKAIAQAVANERVRYLPQWGKRGIQTVDTNDFADYTLDGSYMGIAVLGTRFTRRIEESMINQSIQGFKELSKIYLETEANDLANVGILLLETKGGLIRVRHDITTSTATPEENEGSIGEIKDFLILNTRDVLDKQWIGKPIYGSETIGNVAKTVERVLDRIIEGRIITTAGNVVVSQNEADPRELNVSFDYSPVYPLVWIYITFTYKQS